MPLLKVFGRLGFGDWVDDGGTNLSRCTNIPDCLLSNLFSCFRLYNTFVESRGVNEYCGNFEVIVPMTSISSRGYQLEVHPTPRSFSLDPITKEIACLSDAIPLFSTLIVSLLLPPLPR